MFIPVSKSQQRDFNLISSRVKQLAPRLSRPGNQAQIGVLKRKAEAVAGVKDRGQGFDLLNDINRILLSLTVGLDYVPEGLGLINLLLADLQHSLLEKGASFTS